MANFSFVYLDTFLFAQELILPLLNCFTGILVMLHNRGGRGGKEL